MSEYILRFSLGSKEKEEKKPFSSKLCAEKFLIKRMFRYGGEHFYYVIRKLFSHNAILKRMNLEIGARPIVDIRNQLMDLSHNQKMTVIDAFFEHCERQGNGFYKIENKGEE